MQNLLRQLIRTVQQARLRRINERSLADLDAHTLRDIGFYNASERDRVESARYRLHFGLF